MHELHNGYPLAPAKLCDIDDFVHITKEITKTYRCWLLKTREIIKKLVSQWKIHTSEWKVAILCTTYNKTVKICTGCWSINNQSD